MTDAPANLDLNFVHAMLDRLEGRLCVDRSRIYATGLSDGALFTSRGCPYRCTYCHEVFEKGFVTDYPLTIRHKDGNLTDVLMTGNQGAQTAHLAKHGTSFHAVGPDGAAINRRGGWLQPRQTSRGRRERTVQGLTRRRAATRRRPPRRKRRKKRFRRSLITSGKPLWRIPAPARESRPSSSIRARMSSGRAGISPEPCT